MPESLHSVYSPYLSRSPKDKEFSESASGRNLLSDITRQLYGFRNPEIKTVKYEKPSLESSGNIISVSFTHTSQAVAAVVSDMLVVGIDMELCSRKVNSELLSKRLKHAEEEFKFYQKTPIIQIWTMKEAALKAIGTGLRKPMNGVKIKSLNEKDLFEIEFFNGTRGKLCSFRKYNHWISICYISSEHALKLLPLSYVPSKSSHD